MLEPLVLPAINRLLRTNSWTAARLRPHTGKTVAFACAPFEGRVTVSETGEFVAGPAGVQPDLTITLTPGLVLRGAANDEEAWRAAQVSGDTELAAALDYIRRNIRWDYEEDLSRVVGDVAAHRIAGGARQLEKWGREAMLNVSRAFAEYATHERPMIASGAALEAFNRDVDEVRDAVERLEKRIDILLRERSRP
jgi:ubiquinone biosynthesis accessory factor UbiJ